MVSPSNACAPSTSVAPELESTGAPQLPQNFAEAPTGFLQDGQYIRNADSITPLNSSEARTKLLRNALNLYRGAVS